MFINLTNQNKVLCIKIKQSLENPVKACFKDGCKASNIQLIDNKFGSNVGGHTRKHS